jgi:hypothetical protein
MLEIFNVAPPVLVSVTVFAALVEPTAWLKKSSEVGLSVAMGTTAGLTVILCTVCGAALYVELPAWLAVMVQVPVDIPVMTAPLMLQIVGVVLLLKVTASPEDAVAPTLVVVPTDRELGVKLMVPMVWETKLPVPLRLTLCGLPEASLEMEIALVRVPVVVGVNVVVMVQLAPDAKLLGQSFVLAKSPSEEIFAIPRAADPVLLRVTSCEAPTVPIFTVFQLRLELLKDTTGTAATPVPIKLAAVSIPILPATPRLPIALPALMGEKVTLIVQLAPGASVERQVVILPKPPLRLMPLISMAEALVLLNVIVCSALLEPTV